MSKRQTKIHWYLVVPILAFAAFFISGTIKMINAPLSINEVGDNLTGTAIQVTTSDARISKPLSNTVLPAPPIGCSYQQVKCIQAPCDPVIICASPIPSGELEFHQMCKPRPACLDATPPCMMPETTDMCPRSSSKPLMSPKPYVSSTPTPTKGGLDYFQTANPCGPNHYSNVVYRCSGGSTITLSSSVCVSINDSYAQAKSACSQPGESR